MGNLISSNMEENFKKNKEFIQAINKIKMERQIQMQVQMQQRQMAMQIAQSRDFFYWLSAFYVTATTGLVSGFRKSKKPAFLAPLVPLTFVTSYYWDLAYGNKLHRIKLEAQNIMTNEVDLLTMPGGLPSPSSVDVGRLNEEEKKKNHPSLL